MSKLEIIQPIQDWAVDNEPSEEMLWHKGYWDQICFVRDKIANVLFDDYKESRRQITVINTHMSKSITLPVYQINLKNKYGVEIIMRNNFYDWKVSVKSLININAEFMNLFNEESPISCLYCEGFPKENVYEMYKNNKNEFTIEIYDNYRLYTFMWILRNYLNNK